MSASLASSPFNLAIRPRTWSLSSIFAAANDGSLHISIPAVVFVARQSKFGSLSISILSSVSFNRQVLTDGMSWFRTLRVPKVPQPEIAIFDPFRVFFDRETTIRKPIEPVLDRAAQPRGGGVKFGVAAEQLFGRILEFLAAVLAEQRERLADRSVSGRHPASPLPTRDAPGQSGLQRQPAQFPASRSPLKHLPNRCRPCR